VVTIGSNYKAVDSNTLARYFSNVLSNRMTPEQLEEMKKKAQNSVGDITPANQEGATPEDTSNGESSPAEEQTNGSDTETTPAETETPANGGEAEATTTETTETMSTEGQQDTAQTWEGVWTETPVSQEPVVDVEKEQLKNRVAELEALVNTPVVTTSLAKSFTHEETKEEAKVEKTDVTEFYKNIRGAKV